MTEVLSNSWKRSREGKWKIFSWKTQWQKSMVKASIVRGGEIYSKVKNRCVLVKCHKNFLELFLLLIAKNSGRVNMKAHMQAVYLSHCWIFSATEMSSLPSLALQTPEFSTPHPQKKRVCMYVTYVWSGHWQKVMCVGLSRPQDIKKNLLRMLGTSKKNRELNWYTTLSTVALVGAVTFLCHCKQLFELS